MEKIWLVIQKSNVDGESLLDITPCSTETVAKNIFKSAIKKIKTEGHFSEKGEYQITKTNESYDIYDENDDYSENVEIEVYDVVGT